ncbi:hypothetical protein VIGAN_09061300 [Vigna angularis var. angularis]|uniref:Uncharacterized protein n=1 Tax=Vigna angularis var. angularis TaxID=157739 RepID=A0A0S3SWG2_PHAAN|nr:hypothetical protein VIGAN_09061300 [Vigna angularis var. angularis]
MLHKQIVMWRGDFDLGLLIQCSHMKAHIPSPWSSRFKSLLILQIFLEEAWCPVDFSRLLG